MEILVIALAGRFTRFTELISENAHAILLFWKLSSTTLNIFCLNVPSPDLEKRIKLVRTWDCIRILFVWIGELGSVSVKIQGGEWGKHYRTVFKMLKLVIKHEKLYRFQISKLYTTKDEKHSIRLSKRNYLLCQIDNKTTYFAAKLN